MDVDYKLILPGDRELKIKCKDFAKRNIKHIAFLAGSQRYNKSFYKKILAVCHMCGMINGEHWHNDECPGPYGTNLSDGMFSRDEDLTQFSYSLFEFMGGEL